MDMSDLFEQGSEEWKEAISKQRDEICDAINEITTRDYDDQIFRSSIAILKFVSASLAAGHSVAFERLHTVHTLTHMFCKELRGLITKEIEKIDAEFKDEPDSNSLQDILSEAGDLEV